LDLNDSLQQIRHQADSLQQTPSCVNNLESLVTIFYLHLIYEIENSDFLDKQGIYLSEKFLKKWNRLSWCTFIFGNLYF